MHKKIIVKHNVVEMYCKHASISPVLAHNMLSDQHDFALSQ